MRPVHTTVAFGGITRPILAVALALAFAAPSALGADTNYDESEVPAYTLPDPLVMQSGDPVETAQQWRQQRRPQVLQLFKGHIYGQLPGKPPAFRIEHHEASKDAIGGEATRKQLTIHFTDKDNGPRVDVLIYLPNDLEGPAPVFTGLNFDGNHAVRDDPAIRRSHGPSLHNDPARGSRSGFWDIDKAIDRGYGVMTACYGDIFPDHKNGFKNSVYQLYKDKWNLDPDGDNWSAISAWAWGLRRLMDYAERSEAIDNERVIVMGHSRLGKTSLWAGATDQRFAAVIDNASGCGGSALFRRRFGERIIDIDTNFPHWFCDRFSKYREKESELPVDQHQLVALSAPRPVLINAMTEDGWADPKGMFLSAKHASPVWELLGKPGLAAEAMPDPAEPVLSRLAYHLRPGGHAVTPRDWSVYLDFADRHVK